VRSPAVLANKEVFMTDARSCSFLTGGDIAPVHVSGRGMLGDSAALFRAADISFLNVEHPLSSRGTPVRGKKFLHRGTPEHVEGLTEAGLSAVNLANNHILDFGEPGLIDTVSQLSAAGIPCFGAGESIAAASAPLIVERNGLRVGLLGYTSTLPTGFAAGPSIPGVNPLRVRTAYRPPYSLDELPGTPPVIETWPVGSDLRAMSESITALKHDADVVLVYVHWGASCTPQVHDHQHTIGRAAIDAGAAAVFGGHQHVVSAVEFYRGAPIVHCTGDFVFDIVEPWFGEATRRNVLFGATLTAEGLKDCYLVPCSTGVDQPARLAKPDSDIGQQIVADLRHWSAQYGTEFEVSKDCIFARAGLRPGARPLSAALHPMGFVGSALAEDVQQTAIDMQGSGEMLRRS
jgi:poly-gamma-glutamate capsule biosynthesis protein CapA/YwtB (metallophosphatase superfamily)